MHLYIKAQSLIDCRKCGKKVRPYTLCQHCGFYKGKEFINVLEKLTKKERKKREKEMKEHDHGKEEKPMNMEEMSKK